MFQVINVISIQIITMESAMRLVVRKISDGISRFKVWRLAAIFIGITTASAIFPASGFAAIVDAATSFPGGRWMPDEPSYGMVVERQVPITMDDGGVLYADIGYPADPQTGKRAEGKFPVLLTQNPYDIPGTNFSVLSPFEFYVSRGYIYVVAQVRGTGFTEGPNGSLATQELFSQRQAQDGVQLVDWVAHALDGSNGVVGLDGCSFLGITQIFTAALLGPNSPVKAMVPACAGNGYDIYFPGGIMSGTYALSKIPEANYLSGVRNFQSNVDYLAWLNEQYYESGPQAYKGEHWQIRETANAGVKIVENGIPALLWSGWGAAEVADTLKLFATLQNAAAGMATFDPMTKDQPVTGRYQMIIGSGGHGMGLDQSLMLEWFDHWLKGQDTGIDETSTPMHLYELKGNRWINAATWPMVETYTTFFAEADGALTPVDVTSGQDSVRWALPEEVDGAVTYTTAPLSQATTIAGPTSVSVWASSSNTNMQLVVDLYDVASGGYEREITHGALIGSMRAIDEEKSWYDTQGNLVQPYHPFIEDIYLQAGEVQRFDVDLIPTLWLVAKNHSLRIKISTRVSEKQCGIISGFTLPRPCSYTRSQEETLPDGVYTIYRGGEHATRINLPLLTPSSLPTAKSGKPTKNSARIQPMNWSS